MSWGGAWQDRGGRAAVPGCCAASHREPPPGRLPASAGPPGQGAGWGSGGAAPPPQPHLHMGDMQAPCPATSPRPHTGDVPTLACPRPAVQRPKPQPSAATADPQGGGPFCPPMAPPWPTLPQALPGLGGKQHRPPHTGTPTHSGSWGIGTLASPQAAPSAGAGGGAQGLCIPLPVPWSSGTAREDPWVGVRRCPAPMGDGVSFPAPVGVTEHGRARHPRQTPGGGVPTLGRRSGSPGCRGMTFCSRWNP